jgi:hypothetical protein
MELLEGVNSDSIRTAVKNAWKSIPLIIDLK